MRRGRATSRPPSPTTSESILLAKINYSYEKRQRELAKKKQQNEKQARKKAGREVAPPQAGHAPTPSSS